MLWATWSDGIGHNNYDNWWSTSKEWGNPVLCSILWATYLARLNQNDRSRAECLRRTGVDSQAPLHSKVGPEPSSFLKAANNWPINVVEIKCATRLKDPDLRLSVAVICKWVMICFLSHRKRAKTTNTIIRPSYRELVKMLHTPLKRLYSCIFV